MASLNFSTCTENFRSKSLFGNNAEIGDKVAWVLVEKELGEFGEFEVSWVLKKEVDLVHEQYHVEPMNDKDSNFTRLWKKNSEVD